MGEQTKQSSGSGGPDRLASVKSRVDGLADLSRQLQEARITGRRVRFALTLIILVIIVAYTLAFVNKVNELRTTKAPQVMDQLRLHLVESQGSAMTAYTDMLKRVLPVYQAELQKQIGPRWKEMKAKLESESKAFLNTLDSDVKKRATNRLQATAKRQEAKIWAAFPELKDAKNRELIMKNLETGLQGAVVDVLDARIELAKERFAEVHDKITRFLPEESRDSFHERMAKIWDQVLLIDMKGLKHIDNK